jgi:hypothetical protein
MQNSQLNYKKVGNGYVIYDIKKTKIGVKLTFYIGSLKINFMIKFNDENELKLYLRDQEIGNVKLEKTKNGKKYFVSSAKNDVMVGKFYVYENKNKKNEKSPDYFIYVYQKNESNQKKSNNEISEKKPKSVVKVEDIF